MLCSTLSDFYISRDFCPYKLENILFYLLDVPEEKLKTLQDQRNTRNEITYKRTKTFS